MEKNKIIEASVKGKTLTLKIEVDSSKSKPSSTGKSNVVFTTGGFVSLPTGQKLSINIIE